nr:PREDICTED: uncharacterized protein C1orf94 homolog isoform X2 [Latimeria chalumnae]|eukprot:XP_014353991.1 PREDICTED: uncharacterized protein C1orf94 homolog isoform X2 [Latimeria chalumnae]
MLGKLELLNSQKSQKRSFPLGPFPRHIWIHQDTPQDGLDKTCYEIWKRVQHLSEECSSKAQEETPSQQSDEDGADPERLGETRDIGMKAESSRTGCNKDEISLLVQQEYMSLAKENPNNTELLGQLLGEDDKTALDLEQSSLKTSSVQSAGENLSDQKEPLENVSKSITKEQKDGDYKKESDPGFRASPESTTFILSSKSTGKSIHQAEMNVVNSTTSNKEISKLLAQFSLKHIETSQAPDNKVVMEETKIIKDFLQNSMFSTTSNKNLTPALSTSSEKPADHSVLGQRSQLPVFAKICANIASRAGNHRFQNSASGSTQHMVVSSGAAVSDNKNQETIYRKTLNNESGNSSQSHAIKSISSGLTVLQESSQDYNPNKSFYKYIVDPQIESKSSLPTAETNQNVMEGYNGKDEGAIHPSLSQFKMETCSSEKSLGSMKQNLSVVSSNMKKSVGKSEKSILYELLGTAKKVDGQSALYNSKTDVHGAESKSTTNLKYTGNIFTPRSAATATVTSNRPPLLNYAPPLPPNPSNYTQYQALYQQRARMPYQQTLHPQLGCFARQVNPYNYQQVAQQFLRPPYSPVVSYIPFVQPDFSYQPRNIPKPPSNTQEAPAMAGDGPQFLYQPAYGLSSRWILYGTDVIHRS